MYLQFFIMAILPLALAQLDPRNACDSTSCGSRGVCKTVATGNRCVCDRGWMGKECHHMFESCAARWGEEGRCDWERRFKTPFFSVHCAKTCGTCGYDKENCKSLIFTMTSSDLVTPIHALLEQSTWLVGRWETTTSNGDRFPVPMATGAYNEVLDIQVHMTPLFDRPPLNITVTATSLSTPTDVHKEVGFITGKVPAEDTGFADSSNDTRRTVDLVAFELNSNLGINTVEEGTTIDDQPQTITLKTVWKRAFPGMDKRMIREASRTFSLHSNGRLVEEGSLTYPNGQMTKYKKTFKKTYDYLIASLDRKVPKLENL